MTGVDIHALAGAYALDALDDVERAAFRRHLAQCEACAIEVTELCETAARLADATAAAPPPQLRGRVLAEITRTRQVGPASADTGRARAGTGWRRWAAGAVAAAVLAIAASGVTYVIQEDRVRQAGQVQAVLAAPDAVVQRAPAKGGGEVAVWTSQSRAARVVMLDGLLAPDAEHAYQLWFIRDNTPTDAGTLGAGMGNGVRLLEGVSGGSLAVTLEPAGGSVAPHEPLLATVPLG